MEAVAAVHLEYEGATKVLRRSAEGAFKGEGLQKEGASGVFGVQVHVKYT